MFSGAIIIGPVIMLYLLEVKNLNFTQVMFLTSASAFATVIFEVPTGVVADLWSRKISLLIGTIVLGASLGFYIFAQGFFMCMLAEILFALGFAFNSGADTALLYDTLVELDREEEFQRIAGIAQSRLFWVQALGSIAAGFLYEYNVHLPMIISVAFMALASLVILRFTEPKVYGDESSKGERNYWRQVYASSKYTFTHPKIRALLLYCTVFFVFYRMGFFLFQPYMTSVGMPVRYIGVMFFVFNVTAAITSSNCHKIISITKRRTLTALSAIMILSFLILGLSKVWLGSFAILLQQIARGLYQPVTRKYFNKYITSNIRATVLSFVSLSTRLAGGISYPLLGLIRDNWDIFNTHLILAATMLILTIISLTYMKDKLGVKKTFPVDS